MPASSLDKQSAPLTRSVVKRLIRDEDRIFLADHSYNPKVRDHQTIWPRIVASIGANGASYSKLCALARPNRDYIAYLIGDIGALRCPQLESRREESGRCDVGV